MNQPSQNGQGGRPGVERLHLPKIVTVSIVGSFLLILIGAVYYARGFVLPLILATLTTLTFMPMVRSFARRGVPPALSAVLLVIAIGAAAIGTSAILADPLAANCRGSQEAEANMAKRKITCTYENSSYASA